MTDLASGARLAGYRLERLIGAGGMGSVYLATEAALDRRVAVKVIRPEFASDDRFRRRFLQECKLIAQLEHPAIVPVYSAGESEGRLFIAMRYLAGGSLEERLRREGRLSPAETIAMLAPVADALDVAHAAGVVHRDVTPGNILLEGFGPFLCDFGLARRVESVSGFTRDDGLTVSGTLGYVAPEQLEGDTVDGRTDQYALACVLFECLAGRPPFPREVELAVVYAHLSEPPPSLSQLNPTLPSAVDHAIDRGLAKRREDRFASCAELVETVDAALRLTWTDGAAPPPLVTVSGAVESPYRGLNAFDERDAAFFFGREAATAAVLERLSRKLDGSGLLVISGVSGAGKSSLLRAGVLPRLRSDGLAAAPESVAWPCLVFTPGHAPLDELALRVAVLARADAAAVRRTLQADPAGFALTMRQAALAQTDGQERISDTPREPEQRRLLLVVDQFEQLFTQCPDEDQRRAFVTALQAAAASTRTQTPAALVVLGVRADFEARCADYPQLADAIQDRYLVTAMTDRQIRMAITEPAKQAGSRVEDDLVEALLREIGTRRPVSSSAVPASGSISGAGVLPLLSHALDQAWRHRAGDTLTVADYERTGGVEAAVADSAQRIYERLTPSAQAAARQVFIRLTATTTDGIDTADRVARIDLTAGKAQTEVQDILAVLEAFAGERLLVLATDTVELSHEVLLTAWPLLRDTWLADTRADRIVRTRLHTAATEWTQDARDPSYLYSGHLLEAATDTAARAAADPAHHPPLTGSERDFLHASNKAHRRRLHRRRTLTAALLALVVSFAAAAIWALQASHNADQQRNIAVSRQLIAQSEALGDADPTVAKLESIAAWRIHPSDDARYAMLTAATRPGIATLTGHTDIVDTMAFSPDGKTLASGGADDTVRLWDVATRRQLGNALAVPASGPPYSNFVAAVAFSPDGKTLASGGGDGTVRLWNVATHQQIGTPLTSNTNFVAAMAFSRDGKTLASGGGDGTVWLWNVVTRRPIGAPLQAPSGDVFSVAFSPDGKTLATGSRDGTVRLWNVSTDRQIGAPLTGHAKAVSSMAFSPDGKTLATGSADGTVRLWNVATHRQIGNPLTGHAYTVFSLAFSPDGKTLATGDGAGTVRLWDMGTHQQIGSPLTGRTSFVLSLAFSPDGRTLASGGDDTVRLWDVGTSEQIGNPFTSHTDVVTSVAFSPEGEALASGSADGTVRLWDVATHRPIGTPLTGHANPVFSVAFSSDGKTVASGGADGTARLWDMATHRQLGNPLRNGYSDAVLSVAFSPDGKTLASGSGSDATVRLWNVATHRQTGNPLQAPSGDVFSVAFSPDGKTLATGSADGTARLWNVATREQIGTPLTGNARAVSSVAFSPDGKTLAASGGGDGRVRLWDVATHRQIGEPLNGGETVAFSPDGKTLATGSPDSTVRLWDVATREQIGTPLTGHTDGVLSVAFSPNGKTLASGSADRTVRLWDVDYLGDIVPYLCNLTGHSFTRAEWRKYVPAGPPYRSLCP
jgi:WD40 repeat protein/tRNA A-37 threonylcarbamoyl transferase component Bud32